MSVLRRPFPVTRASTLESRGVGATVHLALSADSRAAPTCRHPGWPLVTGTVAVLASPSGHRLQRRRLAPQETCLIRDPH
jgi:hypothetical protein